MTALSDEDRKRVEAEIAAAEARTGAEFAVMVAHGSDSYAAFSLLWAASLALVVGGLVLIARPEIAAAPLFAVVATLFVVLGLALHLSPIRHRLAPAKIKRAHANRLALVQFASHVQGRTHGSVGVLIFVSLAERYVEILVERGISDAIPASAWQPIVERFVADVRVGHVAEALIGALGASVSLLAPHFPPDPNRGNELPDRVAEV